MKVRSLGREDPLKEGMATHSSIQFAWRTPRTEEPGGLESIGWQSQTQRTQQPGGKEFKLTLFKIIKAQLKCP